MLEYQNAKKINLYEKVRLELGANPEEILVVGDNYLTDLADAKKNKYLTQLITH